MSNVLNKQAIIKKTSQVGLLTLASRLFGIVREVLTVHYLGAGVLSDIFLTAYKIPNSLRKIFAEGALSVAFIPTLVNTVRTRNTSEAAALMRVSFMVFEGVVLLLCLFIVLFAFPILTLIMPGFPPERIAQCVPLLRLLMPLIFFLSSSALLTGALQATGHFFVPAFAPIVLNIVFIVGLCLCITWSLPVSYLCLFIVLGSLINFLMHLVVYQRLGWLRGQMSNVTKQLLKTVLAKFVPCVVNVSFMEVMLAVGTSFASYLPAGSISLLNYANRFMGIPLGVFAVAFGTILLPHFSRVASFAPKRLNFYLLETTKFVVWVMVPVSLLMMAFAEKFFLTLFLSSKFTLGHVIQAGAILSAYATGLIFFSLNKILPNLYYALNVTWVPAAIALVTAALNVLLDRLLMVPWQTVGLAYATVIASGIQLIVLISALKHYGVRWYGRSFLNFALRYAVQVALFFVAFLYVYGAIAATLAVRYTPEAWVLTGLGLWLWVGPLALLFLSALYYTRRWFGIYLHFVD